MREKTVLITGSSRGIGRAAALRFAKAGCRVGINYVSSKTEAASLVAEIKSFGGMAEAIRADVSDNTQAKHLVDEVTSRLGSIDVLINNAGISCDKLFTDTSAEDWDRVFAVNARGAYNCAFYVAPRMISNKRGVIINVSSIWGVTGGSCEVAYSASKAALIGFTKALAKELGPSGIRVNCVAPGVIDTTMNAGLTSADMDALKDDTPLGTIGTPEDVADALLFLASDNARFITGQVLSPNGGFVI